MSSMVLMDGLVDILDMDEGGVGPVAGALLGGAGVVVTGMVPALVLGARITKAILCPYY
jgi:hypothetical protein